MTPPTNDQTANVKDYTDITNGNETTTANQTNYRLTWTVTDNADPPHKVIDMRVTWTDQEGRLRTLNLSSIVALNDPSEAGQVQAGQTNPLLP